MVQNEDPSYPNHREKIAQGALGALQKDFFVIGKTRVNSWAAWLLIGVAAGAAAGIIFVANRSGEFESSLAQALPPAPLVFSDDFNRPDSAVIGNGWKEVRGKFLIQGGELRNSRQDERGRKIQDYSSVVQPTLTGSTESVSVGFGPTNRDLNPRFGAILRYQDPQNYYLLYRELGKEGKDAIRISRISSGQEFVLVQKQIPALQELTTLFSLSSKAEGGTLTLTVGGEVITASDITFPAGAVGLLMGAKKDTSHRADNFYATVQGEGGNEFSVSVLSPNGGETWKRGMTQQIKWTSLAPVPVKRVDIALEASDGITKIPLEMGAPNTGFFDWIAGEDAEGKNIPNGQYRVLVVLSDTVHSDKSDGLFNLVAEAPISAKECGGVVPCSCGDKVVANTALVVGKDPVVSGGVCYGNGLIVTSGVTLDLGGATIRGNNTDGVGILAKDGASDFTITNGTIDGFHDGIKIFDTARNVITKITATRNRYFGILIGGSPQVSVDNRIEDSAALDNGGRGMRIRGHRAVLIGNRAERNGNYGFNIRADNAIIQRNVAMDNGSACIHADGSFMIVEENECYRNGWQGLGSDESHSGIYRNNILNDNIGPGLWLIGNNYLVVIDNVTTGNKNDGIEMLGKGNILERNQANGNKRSGVNGRGNENYLKANTAKNNKLQGIKVGPQGGDDNNRDGGGNIAIGNIKKPECVIDGVSCLTNGGEILPNLPPVVNAGPDQMISLPASANLDGNVTDDGQLPDTLAAQWRKVSGPGTVIFGNPSAVDTTASFSKAGTYLLGLYVFDGQYSGYDDLRIVVK